MEERCKNLKTVRASGATLPAEERKKATAPKEENRIKYLEIYNEEIINNKTNQDSI
jgi:hypothetical protein